MDPNLGDGPRRMVLQTIGDVGFVLASGWLAGDVNVPPLGELPDQTKEAVHVLMGNEKKNQDLEAALVDHYEVPIEGPTRIQTRGGYPVSWNQLDRIWFKMSQTDGTDMAPEARVLYSSRLLQGSISDHLPIRVSSSPNPLLLQQHNPTLGINRSPFLPSL